MAEFEGGKPHKNGINIKKSKKSLFELLIEPALLATKGGKNPINFLKSRVQPGFVTGHRFYFVIRAPLEMPLPGEWERPNTEEKGLGAQS